MDRINKFTVLETVSMFTEVGISFNQDDRCDWGLQDVSKMCANVVNLVSIEPLADFYLVSQVF